MNHKITRNAVVMAEISAMIDREKEILMDFQQIETTDLLLRAGHFTARIEQQIQLLIKTADLSHVSDVEIESAHITVPSTMAPQPVVMRPFWKRWSKLSATVGLLTLSVATVAGWSVMPDHYKDSIQSLVEAPVVAASAIEVQKQEKAEWPMMPAPVPFEANHEFAKVERILKVTAHVGNARSLPDNEGDIVTRVKMGDIISVIDEEQGWYKSRLEDGTVAWIYHTVFAPRLQVSVDIANVRMEPSNVSKVVTRLRKGDYVTKIDELQGWYQVKLDNGGEHWVYKSMFQ